MWFILLSILSTRKQNNLSRDNTRILNLNFIVSTRIGSAVRTVQESIDRIKPAASGSQVHWRHGCKNHSSDDNKNFHC